MEHLLHRRLYGVDASALLPSRNLPSATKPNAHTILQHIDRVMRKIER